MKLSSEIQLGIKRLCNPSLINDESFHLLSKQVIRCLLNDKSDDAIDLVNNCSTRPEVLKETFAAFTTLITESARHNMDVTSLKSLMESYGLNSDRITLIAQVYEKYKTDVRAVLSIFESHPPHITDINWTLEYRLQTTVNESFLQPLFEIELITSMVNSDEKGHSVRFSCTLQHLEELLYILKEATRHIHKLSNLPIK